MRHAFLIFLILFLIFPRVHAGMVKGTIYDVSLDRASDVTIDISTVPKQRYLSKEGTYSFKVTNGTYTLHAQRYKNEEIVAQATETIIVEKDGEYRLDLILFPIIGTQEELLGDSVFNIEKVVLEEKSSLWWVWIIVGFFSIIGATWGTYTYTRRQNKTRESMVTSTKVIQELDKMMLEKALPKTEDGLKSTATVSLNITPQKEMGSETTKDEKDELQQIMDFIQKEGGRITQKELRRQFTSSEAKISLMIAELEHRGLLEKIKKGRGNILILQDKKETTT